MGQFRPLDRASSVLLVTIFFNVLDCVVVEGQQ